jgi:hypothetical protein
MSVRYLVARGEPGERRRADAAGCEALTEQQREYKQQHLIPQSTELTSHT